MRKIRFSATILLLSGLFAQTAPAQDMPPYQPLETRHVCAAQPVHVTPAGEPAQRLAAGAAVLLRDVTFGPDGAAWFALDYATGTGLERAVGYLPVTEVRHFCPAPDAGQGAGRLQTYLAPPNTCHLIAGHAETVDGLRGIAATLPAFAPVISGYRLHSGGYALSLGLLDTESSDRIISLSDQLPAGSICTSGSDFAEALPHDGAGLVPKDSGDQDDTARLNSALAIFATARDAGDPDGMKRACDLGLGAACSGFASLIYDAAEGPGRGPAIVTRYALLGCMAGDMDACQMAINREGNTVEVTRDQALGGNSVGSTRVTTELAKMLCDAQDRVGCVLLARGTAADRTPSLIEAASNFAANLTACQQGIQWVCDGLDDGFRAVTDARGAGPTADERYALAGIEAAICTQGSREPNQRQCKTAYYHYRDFLTYGTDPDAARARQATSFLTSGCAAGDPAACATLAKLPDYWPADDRRSASARAIALCDAQDTKDSICDSLASSLDPTLPEARPALRQTYDAQAQACLAQDSGTAQDCIQALHSYAALDAPDGLAEVEAMLKQACSATNINGCQALARIYAKDGYDVQGVTIPARNDPDAFAAVLRTGCQTGRRDMNGSNTCAALADLMASGGDTEGALTVQGDACEARIAGQHGWDAVACYDAAKLALEQNTRLPDALRWSEFVCDGTDISVAPYGCKLSGNILSRGLGLPADPTRALTAYQRGCFHHRVSTTDGEACLKYGTMLIDIVRQGKLPTWPLAFAHREDGELAAPPLVLAEASRAFDMGCMDNITQACTANTKLLEEWSDGDLPGDAFTCQVRNADGEVTSDKPCKAFVFYQAADDKKASREQIGLEVYVWPDGDRSVTYISDGIWRLNEVTTDYPIMQGQHRCWRNPISTRSFCVAPTG